MDSKERAGKIYRVTIFGAVVNVVLSAFKLLAGIVANSSAMVADAVHSLSDLATDVVVVVFTGFASQPRDEGHDFGHDKIETFSSVLIGGALLAVGAGLFYNGSADVSMVLRGGHMEPPGVLALVAAVVSIVLKEFLYRLTERVARECGSASLSANAWHHRSDAFSSIGVLFGVAGAMLLGEKWRILDPAAAIIVSVLIFKTAYDLMRPGIEELMEKSLPPETEKEIISVIEDVAGKCDVHNLRTRRIGPGIAVEVHIRLDPDMSVASAHAVTRSVEDALISRFGETTHAIVHVEPLKAVSGE